MSEHALLSPSSAVRWLACPGSVAMESVYPNTSNPSAEYGTAGHELAEWTLTGKDKDCSVYLGMQTKNGHTVTKDMADMIQIYVNHVLDYAHGHTLLIEQRVNFSSYIGVPNSFGTSDAVVITADGEELIIIDLKTGYHIVHAEENPQLMLYALGALHEFGMMGNFKRVRLVISQPSQHHLSEWDCSVEHLLEFGKLAKQQAAKALEAFDVVNQQGYLNPEEKACQYCRAAADCSALANKVASTIGADFEDLTAELDFKPLIPTEPTELAKKMAATGIIENWLKSVRAEVERELLAGKNVPGYKIIRGKQGNRKWVDEKDVIQVMKSMKLPKDQMYNSTLISPTDAEKILKIAPDKWAQVAPFITRSEGALSVAPDSDKREAITMTPVAEMFSDLTGSDLI